MFGRTHTDEVKQALRDLRKDTCWIHNPISKESKQIKKEQPIPKGFIEGRYYNKKWIYNLTTFESKQLDKNLPVPDGWCLGRGKKNNK